MPESSEISKTKVWWQAFRYHFVPPSIFPAALGGLISWATNSGFSTIFFLLVLIAIILNHIALNMTDDYFDYKHSVDKLAPGDKNPYTGGSGTLSSGLLSPKSMFKAFTFCYIVAIAIGFYLTLTRGLPILAFGLFGIFCAIFYTAPPINFSHHGLGELVQLVSFGTVIGLGAYYVQAQSLTLEAFLATLPLGIMLFSMIIINEIPDMEEDIAAGKLTLVARYGKKEGVKLYIVSWICTYAVIVISAILRLITPLSLFALMSLPLVFQSIKILKKNYENPKLLAPANLGMIKAHSVTSFGLIGGYAIQGLLNGADLIQLSFIIVFLTVAYLPAAWMLLKR